MPEPIAAPKKLKIVIVSAHYSEGMGYSENCLSRALARLGHDVHVVASTFNVYGNEPLYDDTYREFLGPRQVAPGSSRVDGYQLHRLDSDVVLGYVRIKGLSAKIRELSPDIVHSIEIAAFQTFELAVHRLFAPWRLFTETHQSLSVIRPYMRQPNGQLLKRLAYRLTRTLPTRIASTTVELCYAVAADCVETAERFYGVPRSKIKLLLLGTDTDVFYPAETEQDLLARRQLRTSLGFTDSDVVCLYTGRFSNDKNPVILARAIDALSQTHSAFKAVFVGEGVQAATIAACRSCQILPFMPHHKLSALYRSVDIAVWPRQESMSMLDAAASGLPVVVSNTLGDPARVEGNGRTYTENSVENLGEVLASLAGAAERRVLGSEGRRKMVDEFSWMRFARVVEADFLASLRP